VAWDETARSGALERFRLAGGRAGAENCGVSNNLARIGAVSAATVLSRLLGLARDMTTAAVFGTSALNSAFVTAFTVPNLFRRLLGEGALTSALIPTLTEDLEAGDRKAAFALVNKAVSWLIVVTGGLVVAAAVAACGLERVEGLEPRWYLGAHLARLLFPYLAFVCIAAVYCAALNILHEFTVPAMTAVWLNVSILAALGGGGLWLAGTPMGRMYWLCGGVLFGGFLQMAAPARALWAKGWRPRFDLAPSDRFRELLRLMTPGLAGTAIFQINILASRGLAFGLDDAAATLLYLANRLMEVPLGVFTLAVSTVTFPLVARFAAKGDHAGMAGAYHRAMLLTMHIAVPASVGLFLLARPITRLLFERGAFGGSDTEAMAPVLAVFCAGLPFYSYVTLTTRGFHALKDMATPVRVAAGAFALNLVLALVSMRWFGAIGLALASNSATAVQTIVLQWLLGRRVPALGARAQRRGLAGIAAASAAMGVVVAGGWWGLQRMALGTMLTDALAVGVLIPAGTGAYFALALGLRVDGLDEVRALAGRWRGRAGTTGEAGR
jgi:putative peptidoglycan lipid II flippase